MRDPGGLALQKRGPRKLSSAETRSVPPGLVLPPQQYELARGPHTARGEPGEVGSLAKALAI